MSHGPSSIPNSTRTHSRSLRRIRFRATAFPSAFGSVNPTRGLPSSARRRQNTVNQRPLTREPRSYTCRKSADRNRWLCLGKAYPRGPPDGLLLGVTDGSLVADRELPATFGPPARQHGLAILGFHARPEPVGFGPFAIVRLKRSFWHSGEKCATEAAARSREWRCPNLQYSDCARAAATRSSTRCRPLPPAERPGGPQIHAARSLRCR